MTVYDALNSEMLRVVGVVIVFAILFSVVLVMTWRERLLLSSISHSAFHHTFEDMNEETGRVRVPETPTNIEVLREVARLMAMAAGTAAGATAAAELVRSLIRNMPQDQRTTLRNELTRETNTPTNERETSSSQEGDLSIEDNEAPMTSVEESLDTPQNPETMVTAPAPRSSDGDAVRRGGFRPLHDRVLVRRIEKPPATAGGLIIPDSAKENPTEGEVIAVGEDGATQELSVGDRILFGKWSGTEVTIDGEELIIMKESDIIGLMSRAQKKTVGS